MTLLNEMSNEIEESSEKSKEEFISHEDMKKEFD